MSNHKARLTKDSTMQYDEPFDRLTRLADVAIEAIKAHPDYSEGDRLILLLDNQDPPDSEDGQGGATFVGFETPADALVTLLANAESFGNVFGTKIHIIGMDPQEGGDQ